MKRIHQLVVIAVIWLPGFANAADFKFSDIYYGAGVSSNETDYFDDANGYQIFAGYEFDFELGPFITAVEAGYMDSGDFELNVNTTAGNVQLTTEAKGAWVSGHVAYKFTDAFGVLGRVGYDFGDDDGVLYGPGLEYHLAKSFALRAEYIVRDVTNSLQLNLVYKFDP
jgi:hypothetical protein